MPIPHHGSLVTCRRVAKEGGLWAALGQTWTPLMILKWETHLALIAASRCSSVKQHMTASFGAAASSFSYGSLGRGDAGGERLANLLHGNNGWICTSTLGTHWNFGAIEVVEAAVEKLQPHCCWPTGIKMTKWLILWWNYFFFHLSWVKWDLTQGVIKGLFTARTL